MKFHVWSATQTNRPPRRSASLIQRSHLASGARRPTHRTPLGGPISSRAGPGGAAVTGPHGRTGPHSANPAAAARGGGRAAFVPSAGNDAGRRVRRQSRRCRRRRRVCICRPDSAVSSAQSFQVTDGRGGGTADHGPVEEDRPARSSAHGRPAGAPGRATWQLHGVGAAPGSSGLHPDRGAEQPQPSAAALSRGGTRGPGERHRWPRDSRILGPPMTRQPVPFQTHEKLPTQPEHSHRCRLTPAIKIACPHLKFVKDSP